MHSLSRRERQKGTLGKDLAQFFIGFLSTWAAAVLIASAATALSSACLLCPQEEGRQCGEEVGQP